MMRHFLLAPDSFKGTLTAGEVCDIWSEAIRVHSPGAAVLCMPLSDGGEGMVAAYIQACGGQRILARVQGPLGNTVEAEYALLPGRVAVIEMAAAAGLPLLGDVRAPLEASTYGVGQLLLDAKRRGATEIILGLGGSATNDGGTGMAGALGFRFLDADGNALEPLAKNLARIAKIKPPQTPFGVPVKAACDVDNPLLGPDGATHTFGPQKGVTEALMPQLEDGMANLACLLACDLGADVASVPGSGAAGGMGAAVLAFLGGTLQSGIELMLDTAGFDTAAQKADIIFTGEGRLDGQSVHGKVPVGVSRRAKRLGKPCIALCGAIGPGAEKVYAEGITAFFSSIHATGDWADVQRTAKADMRMLAEAVARLLFAAPFEA